MTDEQLEIIKAGMENGVTLRETILKNEWVDKLSPETVLPIIKEFSNKYGKDELKRLRKLVSPSLGVGITNAARAAKRAARAALRGEALLVDKETRKERLATCNACPYLVQKGKNAVCSKCKCNVIAKTRLATEKCPRDKWIK